MRRRATVIVSLALVWAGCGDGGPFTASSSTQLPPTSTTSTTVPPLTTTAPPATTTTATPTTTSTTSTTTPATSLAPPSAVPYDVDDYGFFPPPLPGSDGAHGSGCETAAPRLADGIWFGFVVATGASAVSLDLACFFTGAAASDAAAADGAEAFDFYIRNLNPEVYPVEVAPSSTAWYIDATADLTMIEIPVGAWPHPDSFLDCPGNGCSVWLFVNEGVVTELVEQYLP